MPKGINFNNNNNKKDNLQFVTIVVIFVFIFWINENRSFYIGAQDEMQLDKFPYSGYRQEISSIKDSRWKIYMYKVIMDIK